MNESEEKPAIAWGIVEVMGHSSYGGVLEEIEQLGAKFLRVTVPENSRHTEYTIDLSAASIFRLRRCSEAAARGHYSDIPNDCRKDRDPIPPTPLLMGGRTREMYGDEDDADGSEPF